MSVRLPVTMLLLQFLCLQLLDLATTLAFPAAGLKEANPLIHWLAGCTGSMLGGLLVIKGGGAALALYCWRANYTRVLRRANVFYAAVVAWNLFAIVLNTAAVN